MWHGCRWLEKCHFVNDISQLPYQQYSDNFDKFNVWTVWTYRLANKWTMRSVRVVVLFISMRYEKQILVYSFSIWKDLVLKYVSNYVVSEIFLDQDSNYCRDFLKYLGVNFRTWPYIKNVVFEHPYPYIWEDVQKIWMWISIIVVSLVGINWTRISGVCQLWTKVAQQDF